MLSQKKGYIAACLAVSFVIMTGCAGDPNKYADRIPKGCSPEPMFGYSSFMTDVQATLVLGHTYTNEGCPEGHRRLVPITQ
jgi:hypothetical protein